MASLAIDLTGGDFGPSKLLAPTLRYFQQHPETQGFLFGIESSALSGPSLPNVHYVSGDALGARAAKPARLIREKGESAIEKAFQCISAGQAGALVSAEHTGALMALISRYSTVHPLLSKPALAAWVPTSHGECLLLDLGASWEDDAMHMAALAILGQAVASRSELKPQIRLLNVGEESFKGPASVREAARLLSSLEALQYAGFIEANEVFTGKAQVVVCQGMNGNTLIKASEGVVDLFYAKMQQQLSRWRIPKRWTELVLLWLQRQLVSDPDAHNGAFLLGSQLSVVKSHGSAQGQGFYQAIGRAQWAAENRIGVASYEALNEMDDILDPL